MIQFIEIDTPAGKLALRSVEERDVPFHAAYLFESPPAFLASIGFDPSKRPSRDEWERSAKERLAATKEKPSPPTVVVAELKDRAVSMVFLDRRNADGVPRLHFHIFENDLRGKGLGQSILGAAVKVFARIHCIDRFLIEPKADNRRMNRLMQKMGYKHLKNYLLAAGPVTQEIMASQYEILVSVLPMSEVE